MSPRTKKYFEAMIREGDSFHYGRWLEQVREEEAEAKQAEATGISNELVVPDIDKPTSRPDDQRARPDPKLRLMTKTTWLARVLRRPLLQAKAQTPKARPRRWLEEVHRAWGEFQASRARDAVYSYLEAIFTIVEHYKVRRRTNGLLRHAFEFANLPFDKNADPFTAVIRCTSDRDIDSKTISKWARALRYVARCKKPDTGLKKFMKRAGGINGCAARYARLTRYR
jgi:hypothetical protein